MNIYLLMRLITNERPDSSAFFDVVSDIARNAELMRAILDRLRFASDAPDAPRRGEIESREFFRALLFGDSHQMARRADA
jgi:hypothetical protein